MNLGALHGPECLEGHVDIRRDGHLDDEPVILIEHSARLRWCFPLFAQPCQFQLGRRCTALVDRRYDGGDETFGTSSSRFMWASTTSPAHKSSWTIFGSVSSSRSAFGSG